MKWLVCEQCETLYAPDPYEESECPKCGWNRDIEIEDNDE